MPRRALALAGAARAAGAARGHRGRARRGRRPPPGTALSTGRRDEARAAVRRQALSVGLATGLYGVSFGALSVAAGLSVAQTCALSLLMFSGGSQFAYVGVIGSGGGAAAAVAPAVLLGVRNAVYGLTMGPLLRLRGARRLAGAQLTIDESTAVGSVQPTLHPERGTELAGLGFWVTGITIYVFWNAMTLAGALAGEQLGDPQTWGLDAAAAGAFLALLWPRLRAAGALRVALAAAAVALAAVPFTPAGVPVLAAAAVAVALGWPAARRAAPREAGAP